VKSFGKHLNIKKQANPLEEKELFCELIEQYETVANRSTRLYQEHGLEFRDYDENFLLIIDNLFYLKYGEWKTEIIIWYIWERMDVDGNIGTLEYTDLDTGESNEVIVKCAEDLWDVLKAIEKK
jgi:hypothetical protein